MKKLSVLICTMDERIRRIPDLLLRARDDVEYVVSWQYTDIALLTDMPDVLRLRTDVTVCPLAGRGLSANRNNALRHATGQLCLIADDDMRYDDTSFDTILTTFARYPETDIAQFRVQTYDGRWLKKYSETGYTFCPSAPHCVYPSSVELVIKRTVWQHGLRFDTRFGLGAPYLTAGEEEILLADAVAMGFHVRYFPFRIAQTEAGCTGSRFATLPGVQRAKGAVFVRRFGPVSALWRCTREALSWWMRRGTNPLPLWLHMIQGMRYILRTNKK
ncbi:MAG: glycosyltransferase family 2 protein [Clostridium sp.]|nr:glycosyltransferase family 2 protein [Clostridium sp.]